MPTLTARPSIQIGAGVLLPETIRIAPSPPPRPASTRWTDDPVTTETPIKAVHVDELRRAVDVRSRQIGLSAFAWTDDPVIAQHTVIRAVHFLELRAAIQTLWDFDGLGPLPDWTAGSPPAAGRLIYATDVNDLRRWTVLDAHEG